MNTSSIIAEPRILQILPLPCSGEAAPGPLHTIVVDPDGNIYYSDEINHSIVSLNGDGSVRWQRTQHGSRPGQFFYPRGLCLGWIEKQAKSIPCLAVCDAWNHRLQFMSLDGNPIDVWSRAGETSFEEACDIQYISNSGHPEREARSMSYWLVLDKGHHRLCAMGKNGNLLFQMGRGFPSSMENRWAIPGMLFEGNGHLPGYVRDFPAFDFCFYPERILGNCENALYVWEPHSRKLKQVLMSNLLPINLGPMEIEWIQADKSGIVGWQRDAHHLLFYDCEGRLRQELDIAGIPVPSNLPPNEFWVQKLSCIERWHSGILNRNPDNSAPFRLSSPLHHSAGIELSLVDTERIQHAISDWLAFVDEEFMLANRLAALAKDFDSMRIDQISDEFRQLSDKRLRTEQNLCESLHHWSMGLLEYRLSELDAEARLKRIASEQNQWNALASPIRQQFVRIQGWIDELLMQRIRLSEESGVDRSSVDKWMVSALKMEACLQSSLEWIYRWSGINEAGTEFLSLPGAFESQETFQATAGVPGYMVHKRTRQKRHAETCRCLREVECISLSSGIGLAPVALSGSPGGDVFVSLFLGHQIVRLNEAGKIVEHIGKFGKQPGQLQGPSDIALDPNGRLWIADYQNHRIQAYDLARNTIDVVGSYGSNLGQFNAPCRICTRPDGSKLVVDGGNHRIIRITNQGDCELFLKKIGRGKGELLDPLSLCSDAGGTLWIVDRCNHRVVGLNDEGECIQEIGTCGLDKGEMFYPECLAVFEDGVIAVVQNLWNRCIKLFSPAGHELEKILLSYNAPGMTVHCGRLYVADMKSDCIHVYERECF